MRLRNLIHLYMGAFLGPFGGNAVLAMIPTLSEAFDVDVGLVALSITVYMIPYVAMQLVSGRVSDVYDRRLTLVAGLGVYAVGSLLSLISPTIGFFLAARIVQGFGGAFIFPVIMAMLGDLVEPGQVGRAMGWLGATTTAGLALGPLIGGILAAIDWRILFLILTVLAGGLAVLYYFTLRGRVERHHEVKVPPIREIASNRGVLLLGAVSLILFFGIIGTMTYTSANLGPLWGEDVVGLILSAVGFAGMLISPIAGHLVDRLGETRVASLGIGGMVIAFILMTRASTVLEYFAVFALLGLSSSSNWAALNTLSVEILPRARGSVASIYNTFRFTGYALAPAALSIVFLSYGVNAVYGISAASAVLALGLIRFVHPSKSFAGE